jgi:hypothetical protein
VGKEIGRYLSYTDRAADVITKAAHAALSRLALP